MSCEVLINLVDETNDVNIIANNLINPKTIVLVYSGKEEERENSDDLKKYFKENYTNVFVTQRCIDRDEKQKITELLTEYKDKKVVVNITGGDKLLSFYFNIVASQFGIDSIYIDIENEKIINLTQNISSDINNEFLDISLDDFIKSSGGRIITHGTKEYNHKIIDELIQYIVSNYDEWTKINKILHNKRNIRYYKQPSDKVLIKTKYLSSTDYIYINKLLMLLARLNLIRYYCNSDNIKIIFTSYMGKKLIHISGYWLELLTYYVLRENKEIDSIKSGVVFLWDEDVHDVKNELDVVASKDSQLICISCKNTYRYDAQALNELEIYSRELGGEDAIKILVSTSYPYKRSIVNRAKEMEINLVIFNGNIIEFEKEMEKVITKA